MLSIDAVEELVTEIKTLRAELSRLRSRLEDREGLAKFSAADIVRSWRDNINDEASIFGRDPALQQAPVLVLVGGKVLYWDELLSNIAMAIENEVSR